MRRFLLFIICFSLLLTACAAPATPEATPLPLAATMTGAPTLAATDTQAPTYTLTSTFTATATATLTATATIPTPTETLLPPLELPTERAFAPARVGWTGEPTYPGDSEPGRLFRMNYDPDIWAQTEGNYGEIVLAHRQIEYCTISPWSGRGLAQDWKVEHEFRLIGEVHFDIGAVFSQGQLKFVTYMGGDKRLLTGFQVMFQNQKDECLQAAEDIFATLRSFAAEPTNTPTLTPEPSITLTPEVTITPDLSPTP